MAELEVLKHGKNVINLAASKEHGLVHKLREIALEVAIIVFAVSISIWFHSMSEHRHEQKQVRTFLIGLKGDLTRDVQYLNNLAKMYSKADENFRHLAALDPNGTPDEQAFENGYLEAISNRFFIPVNSRYEGFKSSGKLTNIEDEELLNDIMTLYQEYHRVIENSEGGWRSRHNKFREYLDTALVQGDSLEQRYRALGTVNGKRLLRNCVAFPQLYERYADAAKLSEKIIQRIDELYMQS